MLRDTTLAALNKALQEEVSPTLKITSTENVSGGCINQALTCQTNQNKQFFVKLNLAAKISMFEAEVRGLRALTVSNTIRIPKPIAAGKVGSQAFLILEYLPLLRLTDGYLFGQQLATMHQQTRSRYGFDSDNFIGTTPQSNSWHENWFDFFMKQRLQYQVDRLSTDGINQKIRSIWPEFSTACKALFGKHQPSASLLHGDLWQGNVAQVDSEICLFDPAVYYGDHEADLAMLELFGSPGSDFYHGYESRCKISKDFPKRRIFYNLYHVLNHSNLFGNSYSEQAIGMMQQIIRWGSE